MTWTEHNRYQASWGDWYVQIELDGQVVSPAGGWAIGSLADYFGLPTVGQVAYRDW